MLLLLAAYTTKEIDEGTTVLSLYGSEDSVLNMDSVERSVEYVRRKVFSRPGKDRFSSLEEANRYLMAECMKLNEKDNFETMQAECADYEEYLHGLLSLEMQEAAKRKQERRIQAAKFPYRKYLEDLELDCLPEAMRNSLPQLATLDFIREGRQMNIFDLIH